MKQIFYGPSGVGKSHLILHGLLSKQKLVIITTVGLSHDLECVGLHNVPIKTIPISMDTYPDSNPPNFIIHHQNILSQPEDIIGFDLFSIPKIYQESAMDKIVEWLETTGISNSSDYTILFINIPDKINNPVFVKKIEKWNADIVVEHLCNDIDIEYHHELEYIHKSNQWFKVPILKEMKK